MKPHLFLNGAWELIKRETKRQWWLATEEHSTTRKLPSLSTFNMLLVPQLYGKHLKKQNPFLFVCLLHKSTAMARVTCFVYPRVKLLCISTWQNKWKFPRGILHQNWFLPQVCICDNMHDVHSLRTDTGSITRHRKHLRNQIIVTKLILLSLLHSYKRAGRNGLKWEQRATGFIAAVASLTCCSTFLLLPLQLHVCSPPCAMAGTDLTPPLLCFYQLLPWGNISLGHF